MTILKKILIVCILIFLGLLFFLKQNEKSETEVVFWTVQLAPFSDYINDVISDFESSHPDIKIKWIDVPYSEAEKRVLASLLSNSMPDLINITSDFNMTLAVKGALAPVENGLSVYNKALTNVLSYEQQVWGIPFYATSAVTIYNKELLKEFGLNKPAVDYDELFNQMNEAPNLKNKYLFMPTLTENDTLYKLLNKYGLSSPDKIYNQKAQELFAELKTLYTQEKLPKEAITQTHREVLEKYSSGQIAYLQAGANFLNIIKENSLDVYNKTEASEQFYGLNKSYDFSLMTLAVPQKAKHKEQAFLFAKFLTNAQNQLEFAKLTGILPCNNETLKNEYFATYDVKDLLSKARYIGAKQLLNPISYPKQSKNHKEVITLINSLVEKILLENVNIDEQLEQTAIKWRKIIQN